MTTHFSYQGGDHVLLLSTQGTQPFKDWSVQGQVKKKFEKALKGSIVVLSAATKMQFPAPALKYHVITQPFLVLQINASSTQSFSCEIRVVDTKRTKRRLVISSSFRELHINPLHAQIPFEPSLSRGQWINLVFDLNYCMTHCFPGQEFQSIESFIVSGSCSIRKIFTMKMPPRSDVESDRDNIRDDIPASVAFPRTPVISCKTQYLYIQTSKRNERGTQKKKKSVTRARPTKGQVLSQRVDDSTTTRATKPTTRRVKAGSMGIVSSEKQLDKTIPNALNERDRRPRSAAEVRVERARTAILEAHGETYASTNIRSQSATTRRRLLSEASTSDHCSDKSEESIIRSPDRSESEAHETHDDRNDEEDAVVSPHPYEIEGVQIDDEEEDSEELCQRTKWNPLDKQEEEEEEDAVVSPHPYDGTDEDSNDEEADEIYKEEKVGMNQIEERETCQDQDDGTHSSHEEVDHHWLNENSTDDFHLSREALEIHDADFEVRAEPRTLSEDERSDDRKTVPDNDNFSKDEDLDMFEHKQEGLCGSPVSSTGEHSQEFEIDFGDHSLSTPSLSSSFKSPILTTENQKIEENEPNRGFVVEKERRHDSPPPRELDDREEEMEFSFDFDLHDDTQPDTTQKVGSLVINEDSTNNVDLSFDLSVYQDSPDDMMRIRHHTLIRYNPKPSRSDLSLPEDQEDESKEPTRSASSASIEHHHHRALASPRAMNDDVSFDFRDNLGSVNHHQPSSPRASSSSSLTNQSLELVFDPILNCYFDPGTNKYYELSTT